MEERERGERRRWGEGERSAGGGRRIEMRLPFFARFNVAINIRYARTTVDVDVGCVDVGCVDESWKIDIAGVLGICGAIIGITIYRRSVSLPDICHRLRAHGL